MQDRNMKDQRGTN